MITRSPILLTVVMVFYLVGCSSNGDNKLRYLESRKALAAELEKDNRLAEAYVQWSALQDMFPHNSDISDKVDELQQLIDSRRDSILASIDKRKTTAKKHELQRLYLKVLALEPGNREAIGALREYERGVADSAANLKAQNIKRVFVAKKQKSQQEQDKQRFTADAGELLAKSNFSGLLQLVDRFLERYPEHQPALNYRFQALLKMGESELTAGQTEDAVEFFERALKVQSIDHSALAQKTQGIKKRLSDDYFRMGMKSFKNDIDKAVDYLQTSVSYNPDNLKAYQQLIRATRIQQNLRKINGHTGE